MKSTYILSLLAFAIAPALSQPPNAARDSTLNPALAPRDISALCTKASNIVADQIAEISNIQSKNLPVPGDLAGYYYGIYYGRNLLGCPPGPILGNANSKRSSKRSTVLDTHPEVKGDPCKTLEVQMEEVYDAVNALTDANIPIPPFLAGRWSLVADGVKALQCGLAIPTTKTSTSLERSDESG